MTVWAWLKFTFFLWLIRKAFKLAWWLLLAVATVATWPVTVVAGTGYLAAWLRGWPPVRLYRAAAWALPVTAAWLAYLEARVPGFLAARDPGRTWAGGWDQLTIAHLAGVFAALAPVTLPAGLALAGMVWAWRNYAVTAGLAGVMASASITFDARQWNRQVRTALGLTRAPGAVPLLTRGNRIPVGGTIRAIGHPWHPVFTLDAGACARHMVIVGSTGSGKTNLMIRLWAGWFTATLAAWRAGKGGRPLLVVLDCKGGRDARKKAERTRRLLYGAGARRVAIWPDEARLSIWDLPPADLAVLLYQMIESGTGAAAYYADMLYACVVLAVTAPPGPPYNTASFLDRLDAKWLQHAWDDGRHPRQAEQARAAARHLRDIQLRYVTLLDRLGPALDGPGTLAEADAWYFILEGTREPSPWPRRRRWRSPSWPPGPPPPWTVSSARFCWPPMTTPRCPGGCRCRTCTSGAGRWASGCRSRRSPGRAWGPMRMSGTGSRPPPMAASSSCIPRTPSPWSPSRASGGCWRPRTSSSAARGEMRAPPGSSAPGPPTRTSSAA